MRNNQELNSVETELFVRGRTLCMSFVFIRQSLFEVPKDIGLNTTHFFILKIPNKREFH